jgi:GntR family transcriptional regulator of vanillate catabolism
MAEAEKKKSYRRALMGLREGVLTGTLAAGERVSEVALADDLGVSRTPLREAMSELIDQGLLERMPTGGCMVRSFTRVDVIDAIELRGTIEGLAFRIAAERGTRSEGLRLCDDIIADIDAILGPDEEDTNFDRYVDLNAALHSAMTELCPSDVIKREVRRVCAMPMAAPSAFLTGQGLLPQTLRSFNVAQDQHKGIIDAIRNREGARAEALAREHARLARRNLEYYLYEAPQSAESIPGMALIAGMRGAGKPS